MLLEIQELLQILGTYLDMQTQTVQLQVLSPAPYTISNIMGRLITRLQLS